MATEKKKQKSKHNKHSNSTQLEIRIPRVQQMDESWNENERKIKVSHLIIGLDSAEIQHEAQKNPNERQDDQIKKRLDMCHEKLQRNNELLSIATNCLKKLDFNDLRKQLQERNEIDTADCLLQDEEDLERNHEALQKQLADFKMTEQIKKEASKESRLLYDFNDSLKDIVQNFSKIKEQAFKQ